MGRGLLGDGGGAAFWSTADFCYNVRGSLQGGRPTQIPFVQHRECFRIDEVMMSIVVGTGVRAWHGMAN